MFLPRTDVSKSLDSYLLSSKLTINVPNDAHDTEKMVRNNKNWTNQSSKDCIKTADVRACSV